MKRAALLIILISLAVALSGCSLGPKSLKGNRIDYNISIHKSNNEDLLVNMVRANYFEPLFFLQVGTVSASFNYNATVGAMGNLYERSSLNTPNVVGATLGASYSEVPTITYAPLQGQQALKQLLSEIPLDRFFLLARGNWSIATLLWTTTQQIGPLYNYDRTWTQDHPLLASYQRFLDLAEIWSSMQYRGELEIPGLDRDAHGQTILPVVLTYTNMSDAEKVDRLLGITSAKVTLPDGKLKSRIHLSNRCDTGIANCVPIRLRSFYNVIHDISSLEGVDRGKIVPWYRDVPGDLMKRKGSHAGLIEIRTASQAPSNQYVAVQYRNGWYYIADNDIKSKAYFMVLATLFSLQSAEVPLSQPLLTLPAAR